MRDLDDVLARASGTPPGSIECSSGASYQRIAIYRSPSNIVSARGSTSVPGMQSTVAGTSVVPKIYPTTFSDDESTVLPIRGRSEAFRNPEELHPGINDGQPLSMDRVMVDDDGTRVTSLGVVIGHVASVNAECPDAKNAIKGSEVDAYGCIRDVGGNIMGITRRLEE